MRGRPLECGVQFGRRERPHDSRHDLAERHVEPEVQGHQGVDTVCHVGREHRLRAAGPLLGRLEEQSRAAGEVPCVEPLGEGQTDGDVAVVAACVHESLTGGAETVCGRGMRRIGRLGEGQGVHVEAQPPRRFGAVAVELRHDGGAVRGEMLGLGAACAQRHGLRYRRRAHALGGIVRPGCEHAACPATHNPSEAHVHAADCALMPSSGR